MKNSLAVYLPVLLEALKSVLWNSDFWLVQNPAWFVTGY